MNPIRTTTMIENRAAPRHRVFKRGSITFNGGGIDCTVRNLSSSGAGLDVASPIGLPQSFTLSIESDRLIRRCHAVWRSEKRIGVAFD
jgi:hypothetical protein